MTFAFDKTWYAPFKASPFRLRYELGGEEFDNIAEPIPRFMQALVRSRSIREAAFAESKQLWAIVGSGGGNSFRALNRLGFRGTHVARWRGSDFWCEGIRTWRVFDVTGDTAACDTLLWPSIVNEMGMQPNAPVICYLADRERGLLFNVYDDRGMDLTALEAETLTGMRPRFDSWLLPYDQSRIEAAFGL